MSRCPLAVAVSLALLTFLAPAARADDPPAGVEVLARGPVHEAYATTAEFPAPGPVVSKLPPQPVEELPPDQKPAGENVQWIPGYWQWDEERTDYVWVSGFWRAPPPGRVWVPGSWRETQGGWQWVQGFWKDATPPAAQSRAVAHAEIEYLPPPPHPLELAPSVPAPSESHFYVPGSWVWREVRYVWRTGFWLEVRPNWLWVPAHFRWTPCGYVFVDGYWDHRLEDRGVLFAPVYFAPAVYAQPAFVYTPTYVVAQPCMVNALFVRRGWGGYYFGDYFEPRYATVGYTAWCGSVRGTNFAVSVGFGRGVAYDPLWSYYQVAYRHDPRWVASVQEVYVGRYRNDVPRPPRTLVQQNVVVNNITNVTNVTNNTVINRTVNNTTVNHAVNNVTMVAPLRSLPQADPHVTLAPVAKAEQAREQQHARELNTVAAQRTRLETNLADRHPGPATAADKTRHVKLDVPQAVVARAQAPAAPAQPATHATPQTHQLNGGASRTTPAARDVPKVDPPGTIPAAKNYTANPPPAPAAPHPASAPATAPAPHAGPAPTARPQTTAAPYPSPAVAPAPHAAPSPTARPLDMKPLAAPSAPSQTPTIPVPPVGGRADSRPRAVEPSPPPHRPAPTPRPAPPRADPEKKHDKKDK